MVRSHNDGKSEHSSYIISVSCTTTFKVYHFFSFFICFCCLTETQQDLFLCLDVTQPFLISQHKLLGRAQWPRPWESSRKSNYLGSAHQFSNLSIRDIIQITIHVKN